MTLYAVPIFSVIILCGELGGRSVHKNNRKSKVREFFGELVYIKNDSLVYITAIELMKQLNLELIKENNHVRFIKDSIVILQKLMNKQAANLS
ncbi:hypothetical protein ACFLW4_02170 [Chloroflexota bacterium]